MTRELGGPPTPATSSPRLGPPPETSVHETLRKITGEHVSCSGMNHYNMNLQHILQYNYYYTVALYLREVKN